MPGRVTRIGVISDTHDVVDPRVHDALAGVDAIVHAGDVCSVPVLAELEVIAPVRALALGNCDSPQAGLGSRPLARAVFDGVTVLAIHDFTDLGPIPGDVDVVVCGHTHKPRVEWHGRVLVVNPGSASQRRRMPFRSVGVLEIAGDGSFEFHLRSLDEFGEPPR